MSDLREAASKLIDTSPVMVRDSSYRLVPWEVVEQLRAALSAEPAQEMTGSYVQPVPDKCDRITWRGRYYHLPLAADRASRLPELTDEQIVSAMLAGSGGDPVWMRLTNKQMIAAGRAVEALVRGKT